MSRLTEFSKILLITILGFVAFTLVTGLRILINDSTTCMCEIQYSEEGWTQPGVIKQEFSSQAESEYWCSKKQQELGNNGLKIRIHYLQTNCN